jgi:hypothetical protein
MEETPTRNRDAVEVGPDQQRTGKHWPNGPARLGGAAQHSIWGFPLIVASSCLGLEGEVLLEPTNRRRGVRRREMNEP